MTSTFPRVSVALLGLSVLGLGGPPARADDPPAGSGVSIRKVTVYSGLTQSAKYVVTGGSPRLQALVRRLEWAENELGVVEQLQQLKLDTVASERRAAALRYTQPTYFAPAFLPPYVSADVGGFGETTLQRSIGRQLAYEATPEAAQQLITFLEQLQTDLNAELKALPPAEKKEAEGPLNALQTRVAALPHSDGPSAPPQPTLPRGISGPLPVNPGPLGLPAAPAGAKIEVQSGGTWYAAEVVAVRGGSTRIHYTGWASTWDEWVPASRIRPAGTLTASAYPYRR